jgi:hypothetical protein
MQTVTEPSPSGTRAFLRTYGPLLALVGLAIAIAVIVRHEVFPAFSVNRDEPVYLWQTQMLRDGRFFASDGGTPEFFQPWLSGRADTGFFSQYTLGFPLVLAAAGIVLGSPGAALALAAALAVVGVYALAREITSDQTTSLIAAGMMTLSPIVIIQSGMYLGYVFSLGLGCLFGAALLAGVRRERRVLLVVAGFVLGWIFLTRPFDAVLWAAPFVGYVALAHRHEWRRLLTAAGWTALGFVPVFLATLAYNRNITGSFTEFPITAKDPLDAFGFGVRRIMPNWGSIDFTLQRAVRGTARNLFYLPQFLFGSFAALALGLIALWAWRRKGTAWLLVALGAVFPLGYFTFWGIYASGAKVSLSGPIYYVPIYAPLCILTAIGFTLVWRRHRALGVTAVVVLVLATTPFLVQKLDANHQTSEAQTRWRAAADSIKGRALVFTEPSGPYLIELDPFSANATDLDGRLLYATDRQAENLGLIVSRPDRTPYLAAKLPQPDGSGSPSTIEVTKLRVVHGDQVALRARITNTTGEPSVVAYAQIGAERVVRTLDTESSAGDTYEAEWIITPNILDTLGLPEGPFLFQLGFGSGASPEEALGTRRVEQQFSARTTDRGSQVEVLAPGRGSVITVASDVITAERTNTRGELTIVVRPRSTPPA